MSNVVLVHGGFVDGSGWQPVYRLLRQAGHEVVVVQNPTVSLTEDAAYVRRVLDARSDVVLVGHSYGGAVITEAGSHPNVAALAYIAAFVPDAGESISTLIGQSAAPGAPVPPILPPADGFLALDRQQFASSFAADVDAETAEFMADSQVPWGVEAPSTPISQPAWRDKPSWYLVTTDDQMIPPAFQRTMAERASATVTEVAASHSVFLSQPDAVVSVILAAAESVSA